MPTTSPRASSSGPPELPGLTAASVWITPVVGKHTPGAAIWRSSWETTPVESEARFSNGLPITATGVADAQRARAPEPQRAQPELRRLHLQQGRVLEEVVAEHPDVRARAVVEHDAHRRRLGRLGASRRRAGDDMRGGHDQALRFASTTKPLPAVWSSTPNVGLDRDDAVASAGVELDRIERGCAAAARRARRRRHGVRPPPSPAQGQRQRAAGDSRDERDDDGAREDGARAHGCPV